MVQLPNQLSGQEVISDIKFIRFKLVPFQKKNTPIYKIEHSPHFLDSQLCLNVNKKKNYIPKLLYSLISIFHSLFMLKNVNFLFILPKSQNHKIIMSLESTHVDVF